MEANMRKKAPRKKPTISHPTPFLTLKIKVFIPVRTNRRRNTSQETIPKIPVVAKKVGISPEPTSKETSQNIDSLTAVGLCSAQSSENLFGPMPRKGLSLIDSLVIRIVEEKEGLTSSADTPSLFGIKLPRNCPEMKKRRETKKIKNEATGKLVNSPLSFSTEENEILDIKITKENTPSNI